MWHGLTAIAMAEQHTLNHPPSRLVSGAQQCKACFTQVEICATGDMLGLGSLTLPSVFARLGWILAVIVVLLCGLGTVWAGRLFALLAVKVSLCSA